VHYPAVTTFVPHQILEHISKGNDMTKALASVQTKLFFLRTEKGATAVEYALMVALIAVVIIAAVAFLGTKLSNTFSNVANSI
jgi:pilus assembly protein Flp/PilA